MEEESWRNHEGGIMEKQSWRMSHDESWRRNHGGGIMEEEAWRRNHGSGIQEASGHLKASRSIWRHLGSIWMHLGSS